MNRSHGSSRKGKSSRSTAMSRKSVGSSRGKMIGGRKSLSGLKKRKSM